MGRGEKKAFFLFAVAMVLFSLNFSPVLTGNAIGNLLHKIPVFQVAGFFFLIGSVVTLVQKK
jgi:hypothetical protein